MFPFDEMLPDGTSDRRGRWRITVEFDPEGVTDEGAPPAPGHTPGGVVLRLKDEDDESLAYLMGLGRNGPDEEAFGPIDRAFVFPSQDAASWWLRGREESGLEPWPEYEIRPAPGG